MTKEILHIQALAQSTAADDLIKGHPPLTAHGAIITFLGRRILAMPAGSYDIPAGIQDLIGQKRCCS